MITRVLVSNASQSSSLAKEQEVWNAKNVMLVFSRKEKKQSFREIHERKMTTEKHMCARIVEGKNFIKERYLRNRMRTDGDIHI